MKRKHLRVLTDLALQKINPVVQGFLICALSKPDHDICLAFVEQGLIEHRKLECGDVFTITRQGWKVLPPAIKQYVESKYKQRLETHKVVDNLIFKVSYKQQMFGEKDEVL